jgi:hypothetical protein
MAPVELQIGILLNVSEPVIIPCHGKKRTERLRSSAV